jgi:heterodisulfide reductase subunit B
MGMQTYSYYPGCSLERNAAAYHDSLMAVAEALDLHFEEVEDWNCCGATEYITIDLLPAYALVSRNLALAAKRCNGSSYPLVAPCSACFLNLKKTDHYMVESPDLSRQVNQALAAGGLYYEPGSVQVKHLLETIVEDVGFEKVGRAVKRPLYNLKVAPYYGCLIVRPALGDKFDDAEQPTSMDTLMRTIGAEVVDFPAKAQCCGGHMTQISEEVALQLIHSLLKNAVDHGADVIVTICPMCQLNLDAYQDAVNQYFGTDFNIPILYFTQLLGLSFGFGETTLGIGKEMVAARPALSRIQTSPPKAPRRKRPSKKELPMPLALEEV